MQTFLEFINETRLGSKERIHNSSKSTIEIPNNPDQPTAAPKPKGIWYGFGYSWLRWVDDERPDWKFKNYFKLKVDTSKILVLKNLNDYNQFLKNYGIGDKNSIYINWKKVAQDYSGIELNPFIPFHTWAQGWDVDSGCIWDKNAIKIVKKISK